VCQTTPPPPWGVVWVGGVGLWGVWGLVGWGCYPPTPPTTKKTQKIFLFTLYGVLSVVCGVVVVGGGLFFGGVGFGFVDGFPPPHHPTQSVFPPPPPPPPPMPSFPSSFWERKVHFPSFCVDALLIFSFKCFANGSPHRSRGAPRPVFSLLFFL